MTTQCSCDTFTATSTSPACTISQIGTGVACNITSIATAAPALTVSSSSTTGGIQSTATYGTACGIAGYNDTNNSWAVGIYGHATYGLGVYGSSASGNALYGITSGAGTGCYAQSNSGFGVYATTGAGCAVSAISTSGNAIQATTSGTGSGITATSSTGTGGVFSGAAGLHALATTATGMGHAVFGQCNNAGGAAGFFFGTAAGNGVYGWTSSPGYAVYANGTAYVSGYLTKSGGGFLVDHPVEPDTKMLNHCFVESPEMKNVYDGVVALDSQGNAVVNMPSYFEAANSDYRYQLTSVGGAAPNLHVSKEIVNGAFSIGGGVAGGKVSWMITGVRADKWALANHPGVEIEKKEAGTYLHPELFGHDISKHVHPLSRKRPTE